MSGDRSPTADPIVPLSHTRRRRWADGSWSTWTQRRSARRSQVGKCRRSWRVVESWAAPADPALPMLRSCRRSTPIPAGRGSGWPDAGRRPASPDGPRSGNPKGWPTSRSWTSAWPLRVWRSKGRQPTVRWSRLPYMFPAPSIGRWCPGPRGTRGRPAPGRASVRSGRHRQGLDRRIAPSAFVADWPSAVIDADGDLAIRCAPGKTWEVAVDDPRARKTTLAVLSLAAAAGFARSMGSGARPAFPSTAGPWAARCVTT